MLAQVGDSEGSVLVYEASGVKAKRPAERIQPYDFRRPAFLPAGELRRLRLHHEEFARALAARLSIYLRLEFGLQIGKLATATYQRFTESLPNPTHLVLFKVEPLRGLCILEMNPRLGLTIVDRLMGGPAQGITVARELTEIEVALLDQAIQVVLREWCNHWSGGQDLRVNLLGHESNARFLQTAPQDTMMLTLAMEARLGDCMEQIQIAFPFHTIEPLVRQLNNELETAALQTASPPTPPRWNRALEQLSILVTAEWDHLEMTARQLAALKPGDVLPLSPEAPQRVRVRLAKVPKFTGTLGACGDRWAVALTEVLKP